MKQAYGELLGEEFENFAQTRAEPSIDKEIISSDQPEEQKLEERSEFKKDSKVRERPKF